MQDVADGRGTTEEPELDSAAGSHRVAVDNVQFGGKRVFDDDGDA
jgi:hypothetical protein